MNEQAIRFRIGIFVLASLIGLGVLIVLFGGWPYFFLPATTYTILFDNAQGVSKGTPVKVCSSTATAPGQVVHGALCMTDSTRVAIRPS